MRNEKVLISLIRKLADFLSEECTRNPEFAVHLASLLPNFPESQIKKEKKIKTIVQTELPDIHSEWNARGDADFRLWIRDQPITILRAIIRSQGFDPTRRTIKWKEAEKLADFISDNLRARFSRGASFIRS